MKILVISGFLGAGKTTFIKELSHRMEIKPVILENEYASINVDEDILKKETDLSVWESTEKCICCTGKADFALNILTIANSLDPEYLIVEPTGVGYLSKVLDNISKVEYERIRTIAPVTVIDPMSFENGIKLYKDLYTDHIKNAGTMILSKCDICRDSELISRVKNTLKELNPGANILSSDYKNERDAFYNGLFEAEEGAHDGSAPCPLETDEPDFEELGILNASIESVGELVFFMEELIRSRYGHIIRAKGTIKAGKELLRVDLSDVRYLITSAEKNSKKGFVLIGTGLDRSSLIMRLKHTY